VTGEFYSPLGECDRISVQQRKEPQEYLRNILAIRTTRPAPPWSRIKDLAIILLAERADHCAADTMLRIWRYTFYPYKLYVPLPPDELARLNVRMPNVELIPMPPLSSPGERLDAALRMSAGDYVAVVPAGLAVEEMWLEYPLYALVNSSAVEGFLVTGTTPLSWTAVLRRADLERARQTYPHLSVEAALGAAGVPVRRAREEELPFQFDDLLRQAKRAEADGNWLMAARLFEQMGERFANTLWMKAMAARAYFEAGDHERAGQLSHETNQERPTVETLLLEAKVRRRGRDFTTALGLLGQAEQLLESHNGAPPIRPRSDLCVR
jgi:hypothetical protein